MKKILMFQLFLCISIFWSCEKLNDPEKDHSNEKEPKVETAAFLALEFADGTKYQWKEGDSANRCLSFDAIFDSRQSFLKLRVTKAGDCSHDDNGLKNFAVFLKAQQVGGVYRIGPAGKSGNNFELQLADGLYRAADWEKPAELEIKISRFEIKEGIGIIAGSFDGKVAKYVKSGDKEWFSKIVPVKGEFRLKIVVVSNLAAQ